MPVNDRDSFEHHLPEIIADLQASSIVYHWITSELLRDLARTQPDPRKYLSSVFERVMSRQDQRPPDKWGQADANIKDKVERLFRQAGRDL